jgi:hypothetical protein
MGLIIAFGWLMFAMFMYALSESEVFCKIFGYALFLIVPAIILFHI